MPKRRISTIQLSQTPPKSLPRKSSNLLFNKPSRIRGITFFVVLLVIGIPIFLYYFFTVREVVVIGDQINITEELIEINTELQGRYVGSNLLIVDQDDVQSTISNNVGRYKITSFQKVYPSRIEIKLQLVPTIYYVQAPNGFYGVSEDFQVVELLSEPNTINYVVYNSDLELGQRIKDSKLIEGLRYSSIEESKVKVDSNISVTLDPDIEVLLPEDGKRDPSEILDLLKKILQKYSIENKVIDSVDLRFSEPVIKFK